MSERHVYADSRGRNLCDRCDRWVGAPTHYDPEASTSESVPVLSTAKYGPCATRLDNQPTPSRLPWRYGHAAGIEGLHWDIYAGEGIDGWLVASVATEADAARIVHAVNASEAHRG